MNDMRQPPRNGPTYDEGPEFNQAMTVAPENEMSISKDVARAMQEVQAAIVVAQRFKRSEDEARVKLLKACKRPMFADEAEYEFPRGGSNVSGPSVTLAREAARVWGNIQYGFEIIAEDNEWRAIRTFAWDVETNSRAVQEDRFKKLIYRKGKGWIEPDERDLRELTNRRAAIAYRNCILQLIPKDIIDEAVEQSRATLQNRAAADPDGERKRVVDSFATIGVMPTVLDQILGHPLAQASPPEITTLRGIYRSIRDGNSTIAEYLPNNSQDHGLGARTSANMENIKNRYAENNAAQPGGNQTNAPENEPAEAGVSNPPQPPAGGPEHSRETAQAPAPSAASKAFDPATAVGKIAEHQRSQHSTRRAEQAPASTDGLPGVFDDRPDRGRRR